MKIITLIFSLYFLALTVLPCGDNEDCKYQNQSAEQAAYTAVNHANHNSDTENCSPFCNCACCGLSLTNLFYPIALYKLTSFPKQNNPIYNTPFVSEVYVHFWRPPKTS